MKLAFATLLALAVSVSLAEPQATPIAVRVAQIEALHAYGRQLLNVLFILNGSAAIALMTLAGNILSKENGRAISIARAILLPLLLFGLGVLSSVGLNLYWYDAIHAFINDRDFDTRIGWFFGAGAAGFFVAGTIVGTISFKNALRSDQPPNNMLERTDDR